MLRVSSGFQTLENNKMWPRAFISCLVFETPMKNSHSFLKYYLNKRESSAIIAKSEEYLCGNGIFSYRFIGSEGTET